MANWYGNARSNYFRVKSADIFTAWADAFGLRVTAKEIKGVQHFAIFPDNTEDGNWPSEYPVGEDGEIDYDSEPACIEDELGEFLLEGEVAILKTIGNEKLRYLTARAVVVTSEEVQHINLDTILRERFPTATVCEY